MDDFKAGFLAGITGTLIGHPFDSVKIHSQLYRHSSDWVSLRSIVQRFGLAGLYNGVTGPLLTRSIVKGSVFATYERSRRALITWDVDPLLRMAVAGGASGVTCALISAPLELIKIRNQLGFKFRETLRKTGLKGLNLGLTQALARDCSYHALYFPMYDYFKEKGVPLAGGFVGSLSWAIIYPFDVLKSREQSKDLLRVDRATLYKGLYKGLLPTVLRAFPVHYVTLSMYDYLKMKS